MKGQHEMDESQQTEADDIEGSEVLGMGSQDDDDHDEPEFCASGQQPLNKESTNLERSFPAAAIPQIQPSSKRIVPRILEPLHNRIDFVYQQELEIEIQRRGIPLQQSAGGRRTIRQLLGGEMFNSSSDMEHKEASTPMKLQVLQAWRELVDVMIESPTVFYEYIQNLQQAFRESAKIVSPELRSPEEGPVTEWFRHQRNLLRLLTHTVQNHARDNSTECRFATLLEIALSYQQPSEDQRGWQPSENLQRLWIRLMQRIDPTIAPMDFRRRAYGVLVSLEWVPASKGLMEACSIPTNDFYLNPDIPLPAQHALGATRRPLPRNDSVYQVLDRLKDETGVILALCGRTSKDGQPALGIGKTVLAALVLSHPLIVQSFQLLWLRMDYKRGGRTLTYRRYKEYLDELLDQLHVMTKEEIRAAHDAEAGVKKSRLNGHKGGEVGKGPDASVGDGEGDADKSDAEYDEKEFNVDNYVSRPVWPAVFWTQRLEEPALRHKREETLMLQAKEMVSEIFEQCDKNILLVLDDASEQNEFEWFRFSDNQSILATTQSSDLEVDWKVEFDPWIEEEAIALFLAEADFPQAHVIAEAAEVKEMVSRSRFHALTVRTLARWFRLKKVSVGLVRGLEESKQEFSACSCEPVSNVGFVEDSREMSKHSRNVPQKQSTETVVPIPLVSILNHALSPFLRETQQHSCLFKLALASMAVVFSEFEPVPLNAVLLLWERLFTMEPDALIEIGEDASPLEVRKRVWFIAEGLLHMGLIDLEESKTGEAMVSFHHEMYVIYGLGLLSEMNLGENPGETKEQWHNAFAAAYLSRQSSGTLVYDCREYILRNLVSHMLRGKLFQKVATLLSNGRLYNDRTEKFGRNVATELHLDDAAQLLHSLQKELNVGRESHEVASHLQQLPLLFRENVNLSKEANAVALSKEVYLLGFILAEHGHYAEAINLYSHAQKLVPMTNPFAAIILYGLGCASLAMHDPETALKKSIACVACMNIVEAGDDDAALDILQQGALRLQGEALHAQGNYRKSALCFFDAAKQMRNEPTQVEFGALLYRKGRLHEVMGDIGAAKEELEHCVQLMDEIGDCSRVMAAAHGALADILLTSGKKGEAVKSHIVRALEILRAVDDKWPKANRYGIDNHIDVDIMLLTAKLSTLQLEMSPSWASFESAQAKIAESPVYLCDQSAYDLRHIARAFSAGGENAKATAALRQALLITVDREGSLERALCLLSLGRSLMEQGHEVVAKDEGGPFACFQQALDIQILKLGDCQQVLETLTEIGNYRIANDSYEEAAYAFAEAIELMKRLGSRNEEIADVLYTLGDALVSCGRNDDAEARFRECMEVVRKDKSSHHPELARPLQGLGAVCMAQAKFDEAKRFYSDALAILEANCTPSHEIAIETVEALANIELNQGEYSNGLKYLFKALAAKESQGDREAIGETLFHIGCAYQLWGDHEKAMSFFDQSSECLQETSDENDQLMGSLWLAMGNSKFGLGHDSEAALYCQRALSIRKSTLGEDDPATANAYRSAGMAMFVSNNVDLAAEMLSRYVEIVSTNVERRVNVEYVVALIMISDIAETRGTNPDSERKTLLTAKSICEQNEGGVFETSFPELLSMVEERLATNLENRKLQVGVPPMKPDQVCVFRRIVLSDD